jgi:uncharacterized protein YoxC
MGQNLPLNKLSHVPSAPGVPSQAMSLVNIAPSVGLSQRLHAYKAWRDELAGAIQAYQAWVENQGLTEGEEDLRIYDLIEEIKSDKLTVALAGEFSRGKTELLNAIFFSDFKQRLLPSGVGRTTMCPTELRFDEKDGPCVRLLPIETRKTAVSISEYKRTPIHWTMIHILKLGDVDEVREAFLEVTRTKKVSIRDAQELGLYDSVRARRSDDVAPQSGMIEIPVWRHAVINYPHPLLKQGLVILDTPGLNALGVEPELTLSMLPSAQAVMFVLGADIGVTRSDLDIWSQFIRGSQRHGHTVVLNKIDALWDELQNETTVAQGIARQVEDVAHTLSVDSHWVFPVSAQRGLIGKIRPDATLVAKSGLGALEAHLAERLIPARHTIIRDRVVREISGRVESSYALLQSKITARHTQCEELKKLGNKNLDAIHKLVAHVSEQKKQYDKELEGFQITRAALTQQANILLSFLSMKSIDALIEDTRQGMEESWTTHGIQGGMAAFFKGTTERMHQVNRHAEQIRRAVERIYDRLHTEYGLVKMNPPPLSLAPYYLEFKRLEEKAELFRTSPATLMTEQHFVIKKFFITLVSQARQIYHDCNESAKAWFKVAVSPVFLQVQQHKADIERKLQTLKKIHEDMDSLSERVAELEQEKQGLMTHLKTAEQLLARIQQPFI